MYCLHNFLLLLQATRKLEQNFLEELGKGGDVYEDWKYERFPNLLEVMDQFHSLKLDVPFLLQNLPLLQCVRDKERELFINLFVYCLFIYYYF